MNPYTVDCWCLGANSTSAALVSHGHGGLLSVLSRDEVAPMSDISGALLIFAGYGIMGCLALIVLASIRD